MQAEVQSVTAKDAILDYIARLTAASREHPLVEVGMGPRGALFLDRMAKAHAYLMGRDYAVWRGRAGGLPRCLRPSSAAEAPSAAGKCHAAGRILTGLLQRVETADRRALS